MKSALSKSPIPNNRAFVVRSLKEAYFDPDWHFHPEYQLFVVLRGTGTRFIGDHVKAFKAGDMVLTGPNLPHLWRSDAEYFEGDDKLWTEGLVIYFQDDFLGNSLLEKEEAFQIKRLFRKAYSGLEILGETAVTVSKMME